MLTDINNFYITRGLEESELEIVELASYYDLLANKARGSVNFMSMDSFSPRTSKNWQFFAKTLELCKDNQWDARSYLDVQFLRASYWTCGFKYPLPNMLYSKPAQDFFRNALSRFSILETQQSSTTATTTDEEIQEEMKVDLFRLETYKHYNKRGINGELREETNINTSFFINNLWELSDYTVLAIPVLTNYLLSMKVEAEPRRIQKPLRNKRKTVRGLMKNRSLMMSVMNAWKNLTEDNHIILNIESNTTFLYPDFLGIPSTHTKATFEELLKSIETSISKNSNVTVETL